MFWTVKIQKNTLILIGIMSLAYVLVFLLSPKYMVDYTVADTEYWRETGNRLLLKTAYQYNDKEQIQTFPKEIGNWTSIDFKYPDWLYEDLKAEVILSRAYTKDDKIIWMDIINSKVGESFHKQKICVEGIGWIVYKEDIVEFKIAESPPNPFTKLYANRLYIEKEDKKQVVVYWFMFKKFGSQDAVTMIRMTAPVVDDDTDTFNSIKDFTENQLFRAMYNTWSENINMSEYILREHGNKGLFAITMMILVPIGIIIVGMRKEA